jgi:hypothetical protein
VEQDYPLEAVFVSKASSHFLYVLYADVLCFKYPIAHFLPYRIQYTQKITAYPFSHLYHLGYPAMTYPPQQFLSGMLHHIHVGRSLSFYDEVEKTPAF